MEIITDLTQLREPSEPLKFVTDTGFDTEEGTEIVEKLKATMEENPDIEALSAPQIGINKRIFCIKFDDGIRIFINPILTRKNGLSVAAEKCSSMPGKEILIARPKDIRAKNTNDSKLLADAQIKFDGKGSVSKANRRGFMTKIFDSVF